MLLDNYCDCGCTGIFYMLENNEMSKKITKQIEKSKYFHIKMFYILKTI